MFLENISYIAAEYTGENNYVKIKQDIRKKLDSGEYGFWRIYNTVCDDGIEEASYEEIVAKSLVHSIYGKECGWVKKKDLKTAVKVVILEYMPDNNDFNSDGFKRLLEMLPH